MASINLSAKGAGISECVGHAKKVLREFVSEDVDMSIRKLPTFYIKRSSILKTKLKNICEWIQK